MTAWFTCSLSQATEKNQKDRIWPAGCRLNRPVVRCMDWWDGSKHLKGAVVQESIQQKGLLHFNAQEGPWHTNRLLWQRPNLLAWRLPISDYSYLVSAERVPMGGTCKSAGIDCPAFDYKHTVGKKMLNRQYTKTTAANEAEGWIYWRIREFPPWVCYLSIWRELSPAESCS